MQIKTLMALATAAALSLSVAAAPAAAPASAAKQDAKAADASKGPAPEAFEAWRLTCNKGEAAGQGTTTEVCELYQPLVNVIGKDPNDATKVRAQLLATIGIVKLPANEMAQIVIKSPLGSILQAPVLKVPGHKDLTFPYLVCDKSGCTTAAIGMEKPFVDALRAAEAAETAPDKAQGTLVLALQVTRPDQAAKPEAVNVKFGIKGFGKGYDALMKKAATVAPAKDAAKDSSKKKDDKKKDDGKKK